VMDSQAVRWMYLFIQGGRRDFEQLAIAGIRESSFEISTGKRNGE
jgi:hypothetical protein